MTSFLHIKEGFNTVAVQSQYQEEAFKNICEWLERDEFGKYKPQLEYLIEQKYWDYLLDCFYQVIPF